MSQEPISDPGGSSELEGLCTEALQSAADRLRVDAARLARGLGQGRLADLVLELAKARHWVLAADRQRIDDLLESIGADPSDTPIEGRSGSP